MKSNRNLKLDIRDGFFIGAIAGILRGGYQGIEAGMTTFLTVGLIATLLFIFIRLVTKPKNEEDETTNSN